MGTHRAHFQKGIYLILGDNFLLNQNFCISLLFFFFNYDFTKAVLFTFNYLRGFEGKPFCFAFLHVVCHIFYYTTNFILMRKSAFGYWLFQSQFSSHWVLQAVYQSSSSILQRLQWNLRAKINYALGWFNLGNVTGGVKGNRSQRHRAGANLSQLWRVNLRKFCLSYVVPDGFLSDLMVVLPPSSPALPSRGNPSCVVKNVFFF